MDSRIKNLFERYQSGNVSAEERRLVEDWFAKFDSEQTGINTDDAIFYDVDERIRELIAQPKKSKTLVYWLPAAAILLVASGLFLFKYAKPEKAAGNDDIVLSAPRGLRKRFKLSDSTEIYLNAGSVVHVPSNYNVKTREIKLFGEGYFEVKHNAAKPFSIRSGKLQISDIGTSFNVKAYPDDRMVTVAVETGEVSVQKNKELLAKSLTSNTQLQYNNATGKHLVSNVPIENNLAWHRNILRFENASMDEIAQSIGRWYNVDVNLEQSSAPYRHYTVSFQNEPLSRVLKVLANLTGATYHIDKQTVSVNLKNCKKV